MVFGDGFLREKSMVTSAHFSVDIERTFPKKKTSTVTVSSFSVDRRDGFLSWKYRAISAVFGGYWATLPRKIEC